MGALGAQQLSDSRTAPMGDGSHEVFMATCEGRGGAESEAKSSMSSSEAARWGAKQSHTDRVEK